MKRKVVIHLGLHKTGSSLLQKKIFPKIKHYEYLSRPYTQLNHNWNKLQFANDSIYDPNAMKKEVEQFKGCNLLISDEALGGVQLFLNNSTLSMTLGRLKHLFDTDQVEVIVFLRGQLSLMRSYHNQWVKSSPYGINELNDLILVPKESYSYEDQHRNRKKDKNMLYFNMTDFNFNPSSFCYTGLVAECKKHFDKTHTFFYEDIYFDPDYLAKQLTQIFGEKVDSADFNSKVNAALNRVALKKRIVSNRINLLTSNKWLGYLFKFIYLTCYRGDPSGIEEGKLNQLTKIFTEDNRKLVDEFGLDRLLHHPEQYFIS